MPEPLHQTFDREFSGQNDFAGFDLAASDLQDLERAIPVDIKQPIRTGIKTDEWLVSLPAPTDDESAWPCSGAGTLQPGTTIKIIYHDAVRRDTRLLSQARELSMAGALIRTISAWLPEMVISGRQLATLIADPAGLPADTLTIDQPAIISVLAGIFDQAWHTAVPLASSRQPSSRYGTRQLPDADRTLVKLLAAGMTDETIARQFGASVRTARRHIAALMSRLEASSRFQAGAEAAKRGWLSE